MSAERAQALVVLIDPLTVRRGRSLNRGEEPTTGDVWVREFADAGGLSLRDECTIYVDAPPVDKILREQSQRPSDCSRTNEFVSTSRPPRPSA
jgi:hypothetical protein